MATPEIILYTNHACPWAHRAHIALAELGLPFKEEIIDLSVPRTPEYLKINPRGLVPSISYNGQILTESGIVSQFLADAHPSHLQPDSGTAAGALTRARIAFFVDAFFSKVQSVAFKVFSVKTDEEVRAIGDALVDAVVRELEPLLGDAAPFFGGSDKPTLAEVLTGSFVLRLYSSSNFGIIPESVVKDLAAQAPNFHRWAEAVRAHPSVNGIYDEATWVERYKERIAKVRAA